ncbi:MAG: Ca-activated chloride channel family protein [Planctomycetota bacterium]|jgi:Ca-activated chloride channel family protein
MKTHNENNEHDWSDDPQLTAYAFGELEGAEARALEERISGDAEALALVKELRAFGATLEESLSEEQALELSSEQRRAIDEQLGVASKPKAKPILSLSMRNRFAVAATAIIAGLGGAMIMQAQWEGDAGRVVTGDLGGRPPAGQLLSRTRSGGQLERLRGLAYTGADPKGSEQLKSLGYASGANSGGPVSAASRDSLSADIVRALQDLGYLGEEEVQDAPVELAGGDAYNHIVENAFQLTSEAALSTFSIDVDTASYANMRRFLKGGNLPPADSVRIEELLNYFSYDYPAPTGEHPFSVNTEVGSAPWSPSHRLVRIGLKGMETLPSERSASNLVFLLDVSGSMNSPDKLPLLKSALGMLVQELDGRDTVSIVVYAGASGVALPATNCSESVRVHMALEQLSAGGSTNGGAGIELAYKLAAQNFIDGGINRVILATDGDFNVGVSSEGALVRLIEEKARSGVFLSVLGFGSGNLQDSKMERLADKGNGNYAYIDSVLEARKVLVEEMGSTLEVIAKDVKIQVEFNPHEVQAYRLIGYENRMLAAQDFNDDSKDAGEIGAGHTVTALYEVVPVGVQFDLPGVDPLKYQVPKNLSGAALGGEMLTVKFRYKRPDGERSILLSETLVDRGADFQELSADTRWAAAVASFGMILRGSSYKGDATLDQVTAWAASGLGEDRGGYRVQFLQLVNQARELTGR